MHIKSVWQVHQWEASNPSIATAPRINQPAAPNFDKAEQTSGAPPAVKPEGGGDQAARHQGEGSRTFPQPLATVFLQDIHT
jgi:hypothetical protein